LSKRKKRKLYVPRSRRPGAEHRTRADLQKALERAARLIANSRVQEAVELLKPFLEFYPRNVNLRYYLGYARAQAGDVWGGLAEYEQAQKLERSPSHWIPLMLLYLETNMRAHALRALRRVLKQQIEFPADLDVSEVLADMEQEVVKIADELGLTARRAEDGLYGMERGQIELQQNNFPASIAASRKSIKIMGDWPPPLNNLSLALFWNGQAEEAIATAQRVLAQYPDNVHALSNSIRFLAWSGREEEAQALWPRLEEIAPLERDLQRKVVDAAAVLGQDESVYQLLHAVSDESELTRQERYFLAVAEANTGRRAAARRHWQALREEMPGVKDFLAALKAGRPGLGWAERYPYFHSVELVPMQELDRFIEFVTSQEDTTSQAARRQIERFVARFPQVVRMAEKLLWEEEQPEAGISLLVNIATPAAYAALRRFGSSQAGDDQLRTRVLSELMRAGEIAKDETLHVWLEGEWRDVQISGYDISSEFKPTYTPEVDDLLSRGAELSQQGDSEQAERLFRRALELNPNVKEAYNNLGTLYARRDEHARAKEMFGVALEMDPLYVFPRCNLASYLLSDGDIAGARAMLEPLAGKTRFHPQDLAFYHYTQARILIQEQEYDAARKLLESTLSVYPDYKLAQNMLDRLEHIESLSQGAAGFGSFWEWQWKRDQNKRKRLQAKLTTPAPTLAEALPLYNKNALTGMGRVVIRWGGWTGLRKAEVIQKIIAELGDLDNLERLVAALSEEEREPLRLALAAGGALVWEDFDARYGNDLEESAYWEWHAPETTMGRLRLRGLLVEALVDGELLIVVPDDLRQKLREVLEGIH